jgi:hypothetical protein
LGASGCQVPGTVLLTRRATSSVPWPRVKIPSITTSRSSSAPTAARIATLRPCNSLATDFPFPRWRPGPSVYPPESVEADRVPEVLVEEPGPLLRRIYDFLCNLTRRLALRQIECALLAKLFHAGIESRVCNHVERVSAFLTKICGGGAANGSNACTCCPRNQEDGPRPARPGGTAHPREDPKEHSASTPAVPPQRGPCSMIGFQPRLSAAHGSLQVGKR